MEIISCLINKLPDARVEKMGDTLVELGHNSSILFIDSVSGRSTQCKSNLLSIDLKTKVLPSKKFFQFFKYLETLFRFGLQLNKIQPDIIVLNDVSALPLVLVKVLSNKKIYIIYDSHEYWKEVNRTRYGTVLGGFISLMERFFIKYIDATITVSQSIADELIKVYELDDCKVIKNYPRKDDVERITPNKKTIRQLAKIDENVVLCVFVGGMQRNRGIELLVDVMSDTSLSANIHLAFVGSDNFPEWINSDPSVLRNISFHGQISQSELVYYISSADIGIHPIQPVDKNHYLCLPNKIFEYTSAGLCLIVSDMLELKGFVELHNNGRDFRYNDVSELVNLLNLLDNDRTRLEVYKSNSKAISSQIFWESQIETIEKVLQIDV